MNRSAALFDHRCRCRTRDRPRLETQFRDVAAWGHVPRHRPGRQSQRWVRHIGLRIFRFSNDHFYVENVREIVRFCMNILVKTINLCANEKGQIQIVER